MRFGWRLNYETGEPLPGVPGVRGEEGTPVGAEASFSCHTEFLESQGVNSEPDFEVAIKTYLSRQEGRITLISQFISFIYNVQIFRHRARGPVFLHLLCAFQMSGVGVMMAHLVVYLRSRRHSTWYTGVSIVASGGLFFSPMDACKNDNGLSICKPGASSCPGMAGQRAALEAQSTWKQKCGPSQ